MEMFLTYLKVFAIGGLVCMIGQILINKTKMSSARILVLYMIVGVILEITGAFEYMKEFAGSGVTIPIMGFGSNLAKGALEGVKEQGFLGAIAGGMSGVAAGLTTAIVCGFVFGLIAKSRSKKI
ncbi:MAG: SpoVA/SpoVAEb family sporulation membrane protein [Bacteroides sp.]|nr:SpoVA/SpoVAEb family sporulation membrane protein [Bacillota bacterium]MCM1394040.1 SpoVA/SpoVAEb family sporulation membrane protein [[Eubacterium] siraeum]MCM1455876.1 SpoVA/SpoVAEb family sporulation membrane protein [Bacteroides sp.]